MKKNTCVKLHGRDETIVRNEASKYGIRAILGQNHDSYSHTVFNGSPPLKNVERITWHKNESHCQMPTRFGNEMNICIESRVQQKQITAS